ncbi:N-acetyltransferase family protein [Planctomicrobium sp. SH664]|uniref:GNAT family N-acetyltransferase n=1 Tax=Planctomicrobium sp. SH664 TaxID=3448125 RepID=UPI003F5BF6E3
MTIRRAGPDDAEGVWAILNPVIREGVTYALPREMSREQALAFWFHSDRQVYVAEEQGAILGTFYLRPNYPGGGAHVANCGYATSTAARRRGIARRMGLHSLEVARAQGYRAMQFNFVVSTNLTAVRLWKSIGFQVVGTLPGAFAHPEQGDVNALVMFQRLD